MSHILTCRLTRKITRNLLAVSLLSCGLLCADYADSAVYDVRLADENPTLARPLGQENSVFYAIPQDVAENLRPGMSVTELPSGCSKKFTRDRTYFDCSGTYFEPFFKGSQLVYMVISRP